MSLVRGFFAYPSGPADLNETIDSFISKANNSGIVNIISWKNLDINGTFIIDNILEEIDKCQLFLCDLTYLNFNVLFELGYAIAKNKKIWITLNPDIESSRRDYDRLKVLTTIGYTSYSNINTLLECFYKEQPYLDLEKTILSQISLNTPESSKIVYLKSAADTDASLSVSVSLKESTLPLVMDDPKEVFTQPLSWYIKFLTNAYGAVIHFLSEKHAENINLNAKHSLISGLAIGLSKPILMLAHEPFKSPIDYRDILKVHTTSKQSSTYITEWLEPIIDEYKQKQSTYVNHLKDKKALLELQNLFVGEPIAEHESDMLTDYFFETREYIEALNAQQTLFVGRKGTGKTANFYKIADQLSQDKRNFVCIIQPVGHEIDGVLNLLGQALPNSEKGYLIESIWKYLIYSELARSVYESILNKPTHIPQSDIESDFVKFVRQHEKMINADFSLRLENAVKHLLELSEYKDIESHRIKVSEILHETMITNLRTKLGEILENKNKVCILIDNLDASWTNRSDLQELCLLLFGLLNVLKRITDEFYKADYRQKRVSLSLIAFLRSDIFNQIVTFANERDKIQHSKLVWNDPEQLFRVIETRFDYSMDGLAGPQELWNNFFCSTINGMPLREYVTELILPRPRDIIYLFRAALQEAVNRGHSKVEEADFLSSEFKYSQYVLESVLAENGNRVADLESLLYEFAGCSEIISKKEIEEIVTRNNFGEVSDIIDILCELTFLGLETNPGKFEFINEQRSKKIVYRLADKTVQISETKEQRFKIHKAFHSYLDIK